MTRPRKALPLRVGGCGGGRRARWVAVAMLFATLQPAVARAQEPASASPERHYQAARAAFTAGDLGKADMEVRLALQGNPSHAASHFMLGCLLERKGEDDQAVVGFQQALALDPTSPGTLYNLGTLLLRRGEAVSASRLLEAAARVRPGHVSTYNNLGKAYFLAGLPDLAVGAYEEVLRLDPWNVTALRNLLRLAESAGLDAPAASYRRRLEVAATRRGAAAAGVSRENVPVWPIATVTAGSTSMPPASDIAALEAQVPPDEEVDALRDILRDLPHVAVERRGGRLVLVGWTRSPREKEMLGRILGGRKDVLDLTTDDAESTERMLEVDAIIFIQTKLDQTSVGFNFLNLIKTNFSYFAADHRRDGTGYQAPDTIGAVTSAFQAGWVFGAAVDYSVNIANAATQQVAVLARPHLTTLSGTPATFLAGGEIVFKVSGINSGDIKPYPFGTTLKVTPTLLRTPGDDGPLVHVAVEAGRTSVLELLAGFETVDQVSFDKISVGSQTIVGLGRTLILSGLNQRESRTGRAGVPGLMYVPLLKHLFSTKTTVQNDTAVIILLTPRDPAYMDARNREALAAFVEKRRAFVKAYQGTAEDLQRFRQQNPDWDQLAPNRFASHFFLVNNSELYRVVSAQDIVSDALDLDILGISSRAKGTAK